MTKNPKCLFLTEISLIIYSTSFFYFGQTISRCTSSNLSEITAIFKSDSNRLSRGDQKFIVKSLQSSVHLASSGLFKKIFVCVELSQQLNLILKGLVKVASNLVSVSWFDEIAIELLVIIQSIVTIGSKEDGLLIR